MLIHGACHCGNVSFRLAWEPDPASIPARACGCTFCVKHGGVWTSNPAGTLRVKVKDAARMSIYSFGTHTANFHVCSACGVVPVVASVIDGREYAVVNVNAFENVDPSLLRPAPVSFDGEEEGARLARRKRGWIGDVSWDVSIPGRHACREMGMDAAPRLQRFFDANPEYFIAVNGEPARDGEAAEELASRPPADMRFTRAWNLEFNDGHGEMTGMAGVVSDLLAPSVWHIGLFIVATKLHGTGVAREMHGQLEAWMRASGARWLRLGVVAGNARAERFWEKLGYVETRRRKGVHMGKKANDLRVMVKPLGGGTVDEYLALVPRDRPEPA
jgi:RimJ/RimL family protein N-acetyltransferase